MVSASFISVCAVGFAGSLFLGYCVYFDKKRRSDPDYKKKVLARRRSAKKQDKTVDLRDPKVRQEFLTEEMVKANQKLTEGKLEEAVGHFINFVHFSGNPRQSLMMLQQTLPATLFRVVCQAYALVQEEGGAKTEEEID